MFDKLPSHKYSRLFSNRNTNFHLISLALDPIQFMADSFGMVPDTWQANLLRNQPDNTLLLCSRQSGKSTVSAALSLYRATFYKKSLVLIISASLRQAEELFRKVKSGLSHVTALHQIVRENQSMLELSNGSRIISLPGREDTVRSYSSVDLLVIDEAAQVSDALYATIRPMLAISQGKLLALTTPFGKRGWFFKTWTFGGHKWVKVKVTANECSRISQDFIDQELKEVGEWWVKQEYYCEFVDTENQLFEFELIEGAVSNEVSALIL